MKKHIASIIILLVGICVREIPAQEPVVVTDTLNIVFELGEVQVTGDRAHPFSPVISAEELAENPRKDVSRSLDRLPGVFLVLSGAKNESMVNVRGFDQRQVPVYLDGVPIYVSYDGYTDLGRLLVSDLSKITLTRGESTLLMGPNAMGGAINLVSRKPAAPFDLEVSGDAVFDRRGYGGIQSAMNIGTRREKFYFQGGLGFVDEKPYAGSGGGTIFNSQHRDLNSSLKFGITPHAGDSYVFSYHHQQGAKGVPEYEGEDPNQRARYWTFPSIQNQGIHFNSRTRFGSAGTLQTRFYYDRYFSDLRSYDDSTFSSQDIRSSFTSIYDDRTMGSALIYSLKPGSRQSFKTAMHVIYDHHSEHNSVPVEEAVRHFRDLSLSLGVEDKVHFTERLQALFGIGYHIKNNLQADDYSTGSDSVFAFSGHHDRSFNFLGGMQYDVGAHHIISGNLSRKSRFPTMKDRYSYRLGRSIPNPDLTSEASWNADIGYAFLPDEKVILKTSLFYSQLQNTIQAVYRVDPEDSGVYQYQNTGKARFYGFEADLKWDPLSTLKTGLQYTFTDRKNLSHPDIYFTDLPKHKIYFYLDQTFLSRWVVGLSGMYNSARTSTTNGLYGTDPFITIDFRTSLKLFSSMSLETSVTNLLDADYSYMEGFAAPGRQFRAGFRYLFL